MSDEVFTYANLLYSESILYGHLGSNLELYHTTGNDGNDA